MKKIVLGSLMALVFLSPAMAKSFGGHMDGHMGPPPIGGGFFDNVDINRDGMITRDEVLAAHRLKFTQIDKNKDGYLTKSEFKDHMKQQFKDRKNKDENIFAFFDADKSGYISKTEWQAAVPNADKVTLERMALRFDTLDKNNDGKLSKSEMDNLKPPHEKKRGYGFFDKKHEHRGPDLMGHVDANQDGKISRAEWEQKPMPLFEMADTNKDGKISKEEAQSAMQNRGKGGGKGFGQPPRY